MKVRFRRGVEKADMKHAKSQTPPAKTQMVRLDTGLWKRVNEAASRAGRTPRQEIESRLRQSLAGISEAPSINLVPKALAIGRLMARLANDVIAYSETGKTVAMLKASGSSLLAEMGAADELSDEAKQQAKMFADYLRLKMMNAEERTFNEGVPTPLSLEQRELLEIREVLGEWVNPHHPEKNTTSAKHVSGKERK